MMTDDSVKNEYTYDYGPFKLLPTVNALFSGFSFTLLISEKSSTMGYIIAGFSFLTFYLGILSVIAAFLVIFRISKELNRDQPPSKADFRDILKYTPNVALLLTIIQSFSFAATTLLFIWSRFLYLGPIATVLVILGIIGLSGPAYVHYKYRFVDKLCNSENSGIENNL